MQNYKKMCNIKTISADIYWISGKFVGRNYALLLNRQWNKKQKHKKQPWSNVECFAFGGGIPHCPKDKNLLPFHGEKPLVIK